MENEKVMKNFVYVSTPIQQNREKRKEIVFTTRDNFKKCELERTFDLEENAKLRKEESEKKISEKTR